MIYQPEGCSWCLTFFHWKWSFLKNSWKLGEESCDERLIFSLGSKKSQLIRIQKFIYVRRRSWIVGTEVWAACWIWAWSSETACSRYELPAGRKMAGIESLQSFHSCTQFYLQNVWSNNYNPNKKMKPFWKLNKLSEPLRWINIYYRIIFSILRK